MLCAVLIEHNPPRLLDVPRGSKVLHRSLREKKRTENDADSDNSNNLHTVL